MILKQQLLLVHCLINYFHLVVLLKYFEFQTNSKTILIELPAITPVPGPAGRIKTLQAPSIPITLCGTVFVFVKGI